MLISQKYLDVNIFICETASSQRYTDKKNVAKERAIDRTEVANRF
jgi:hypothetical protein